MFDLATTPFAPTSNWNTPIGADAAYSKLNWPASTGYNYAVNWDSYSPSVYVASSTDPLVQVTVPAGWGYPAGTVSVHMPADANRAAGTDGELLVIDGNTVYNFWEFNRNSTTTATADAYGQSNVATGSGWGSTSPFLSAGTTAAGSSELGGLLVQAETDTGHINHALQLVVDSNLVKSGFTGPAIAGDGGSGSGIVQEGDHLAISPDTPMPTGLSTLGQEVFHALQQYGAYVVDVAGGTTVLRAQANGYEQSTIQALWHDMGSLTPLLGEVTGGTPGTSIATSSSRPPTSPSINPSGSGVTDATGAPTDAPGTPATNEGASESASASGNPAGSGSSAQAPSVGSHDQLSSSSAGSTADATDTSLTSHNPGHTAHTDFWAALIDAAHNLRSASSVDPNGTLQFNAARLNTFIQQVQSHQQAGASFDGAQDGQVSGHGDFAANHIDFGLGHGQTLGHHQQFELMWHHA